MASEENITAVEHFGDMPIALIKELASRVVKYIASTKKRREEKMDRLCDTDILGWQYNEALMNNFVKTRFSYYGTSKTASVQDILREIERERYARNIIITGPAGSGKSTVLKWLYLNANIKNYSSLYIQARKFNQFNYESFGEVLETLDNLIKEEKGGENKCIVFIDGLDELSCLQGKRSEFDDIIDYFNKNNSRGKFKFVISTRPEHFAFQKRIKKRDTKKTLDNYLVFETKPLTKREAYLVCKTIGKLMLDESKLQLPPHFAGKYPGKRGKLSESEYLKQLKQHLNESTSESFMFSIPLLCRYAYPIICELSGSKNRIDNSRSNITKYDQIETAIRACIKWEFHDFYEGPTDNYAGQKDFSVYEAKITAFLTKISGKMGLQDQIRKQDWEQLNRKNKMTLNESYCILQECAEDQIAFAHASFRDYYMARYYVEVLEGSLSRKRYLGKTETYNLSQLLKLNSEFAAMYVERMSKSKNATIRRIFNYLRKTYDFDSITEIAKGNKWYIFHLDEPFTIKEYLLLFPQGRCRIYNISFDLSRIMRLERTGILEVSDSHSLKGCDFNRISSNLQIHGIIVPKSTVEEIKLVSNCFYIAGDGNTVCVGGYWKNGTSREYLQNFLEHVFPQYFDGTMTARDILKLEEVRVELRKQTELNNRKSIIDVNRLKKWIQETIAAIGPEKRYWCYYYASTLYIYEMIPQNETRMNDLFCNGLAWAFANHVSLYGAYLAKVRDPDSIENECKFCDARTLSPAFKASHTIVANSNLLEQYYNIHWKNLYILQNGYNYTTKDSIGANSMTEADKLLLFYDGVSELFESRERDKLYLMYSDEKLISLYILGDGESMVELANSTLELCKKYNHFEGIEFRKFLTSDETRFLGEDYQRVLQYCKDHIWL